MQVGLSNNITNSFGAKWSTWLQPHFDDLKKSVYRTQCSQEIDIFQRNANIINKKFDQGLIKLSSENVDGISKNNFYLEFYPDKKIDILTTEKGSRIITMGILQKIAHKLEKISRD